jgi:predicted glutamine amidotransferase
MAKFAAYLGPSSKVASLVERGTHSLARQSAEQPDGFGVGWYPEDDDPSPLVLSTQLPLWSEDRILKVARRYKSACTIAGLRKIDAEKKDEPAFFQPIQYNQYLFYHDGELAKFRDVYERPLRSRLSDRAYRTLRTSSMAELLFATWLDALGDQAGPDATANALEQMVNVVRDIAMDQDAAASFAVLVADGSSLVTLRTATHGTPPPMYTIVAGEGAPVPETGRVIASEPLFPGSWSSLDAHSLVIFSAEAPTAEAAG